MGELSKKLIRFLDRYDVSYEPDLQTTVLQNDEMTIVSGEDWTIIKSRLDRLKLYEQECKPVGAHYAKGNHA